MIEELVQYLEGCETEVVAAEDVALPAGQHSILVLPCYNLLEMMEEACDEAESLPAFVEQQLADVHSLSADTRRLCGCRWAATTNVRCLFTSP
ncbi:hypothetical protein [Brevibacillus agri]|uniref:hypothetical protein n=1 Tax=Brevibacillus agri TaxID=51101 RepID=UPI0025B70A46|nr:hypothetical protein [Brevibacillus agri]MDN4096036.1 hypothetical protein [Brevibacillus agri]MDR9507415.1 hypothetical protein [Brevibacillus agri]MED3498609.1 hypothetical protein [Brevibacillus agri]